MTDRELLELAAKAAGIEWKPAETDAGKKCELKFGLWLRIKGEPTELTRRRFNPLTDDGDALRLAVKLGLILGTYAHYVTVDLLSPNDRIETITVWHSQTNDPYAATRRAIVRAAAEIGRSMK